MVPPSNASLRQRRSVDDSNTASLRQRGWVDDYEQVAAASSKAQSVLGIGEMGGSAVNNAPLRRRGSLDGSNTTSNASRVRRLDKAKAKARKLLGLRHTAGSSFTMSEHSRLLRADPDDVLGAGEIIAPETTTSRGVVSKRRRGVVTDAFEQLLRSNPVYRELLRKERFMAWAASFRRLDPRYSILRYFNDCALGGLRDISDEVGVESDRHIPPILRAFRHAAVFTVWRPTSKTAIRRMMLGEGTGKALNVTGKSAKGDGRLSGYVPFVQIHEEEHKGRIKELPPNSTVRIFYREREQRTKAMDKLGEVLHKMTEAVEGAKAALMKDSKESNWEETIKKWDINDPSIEVIDNYAGNKGRGRPCYGIEIPERLFWEAYIVKEDISREPNTDYDTQRPSEPHYQDMNFLSTRNYNPNKAPRTVVWQHADPEKGEGPMDPRTLLVAYEQNGGVLPVVSDFDCFLVGTRGVSYERPLIHEQVMTMHWCIDNLEDILDKRESKSWAHHWLDAIKLRKPPGGKAEKPKYGYGDPKSYSIMLHAAGRMSESGAVRHGPECFNYCFPQSVEDEYLVVHGDAEAGEVPWTYVNEAQLRFLLCGKIGEGYTFPLNPKWVLCNPGWKDVYDSLTSSEEANVRESLNCWYPPGSGIRQRIEAISARHPDGLFVEHGEEYAEKLRWEQELQREHYYLFDG